MVVLDFLKFGLAVDVEQIGEVVADDAYKESDQDHGQEDPCSDLGV